MQTPSGQADHGPHHLAQAVGRALVVAGLEPLPEDALHFFFSLLYEASFQSENGRTLRGRVIWLRAGIRPDPAKPGRLLLMQPVPLSASSLASFLGGSAAPPTLLVSAGETFPLMIQGLLSGDHLLSPAGLLSAQILGPAHLKVDTGLDAPLELRRNRLRVATQRVFERGLVRARLSALFQNLYPAVRALLSPEVASSPLLSAGSFPLPGGSVLLQEQDWPETLEQFWVQALALLLRRMEEAQHGGCVLLMPREEQDQKLEEDQWLLPPQGAAFSQLRQGLERCAAAAITQQVLAVHTLAARAGSMHDLLPDQALQEPRLAEESLLSDPQITDAVGLLASLTQKEGLLRLDSSFELMSFGGQPNAAVLPDRVYLAGDEAATAPTPISSRSFGPRNLALLSLCQQDPESVGFALTQDGDLRAMLWHDGKLLVWNSVLLPRS